MTASSRLFAVLSVGLALTFLAGTAEARRGGSFGSRGMRTYSAPRPTPTAPQAAAPIQRSMTPKPQPGQAQPGRLAAAPFAPGLQPQGGFLRRWGGPLLGGLALGGLVGMLMGHGFGAGMGGMMSLLLQAGLAALAVMLVVNFFRRRQGAALTGAGAGPGGVAQFQDYQRSQAPPQAPAYANGQTPAGRPGDEIGLTDADFDAFERLLTDVQTAYGRADLDALRALTTPEAMSYLAEELAGNALAGRRNAVSEVKLLQGDLSEAWRENDTDYATVAMRYSSLDVTRDTAGAVVDGDPDRATETTELWTFAKQAGPWGERWKLSAIQDT